MANKKFILHIEGTINDQLDDEPDPLTVKDLMDILEGYFPTPDVGTNNYEGITVEVSNLTIKGE